MTLTTIIIFLFLGVIGHLVCMVCDRKITYTPNGRFNFNDLHDNEKLSQLFLNTPLNNSIFSILAGVFSLLFASFGYIGLVFYFFNSSIVYGTILLISFLIFITSGVAHHIICGIVEWFYIRMNRTEEARKSILEFFKKTSVTMGTCYIALLTFLIVMIVGTISGVTALPWYACFINTFVFFFLLFPFKIVGSFNLASALMFLGLAIMLCLI